MTLNHFQRMVQGEVPPPAVAKLLGGRVIALDLAQGSLTSEYQGNDTFLNPAGQLQGGILGAMLDDVTAGLVDATVQPGEGVATLSLTLSFLRPAVMGPVQAHASLIRRGRDICHVQGTLSQAGQAVASAVAVCKVIR
jgi:uncharacterized protein (TIGR00369 family)